LISAVIITYNEENNIAACIDSLKDIVTEILVYDSFSTDRTVEIAISKGAKVVIKAFKGYGQTKNVANSLTGNDWILSIDADERPDTILKAEIINAVNTAENYDAFKFNRLNFYCGKAVKYGAFASDIKVRLWRKNKAYWNNSVVHEELIVSGNCSPEILKGNLLHYTYSKIEDHKNKIEKYTDLAAIKLFQNNKSASFVKLYLSPIFSFIRDYFLKLGILDGLVGFHIARLSAYEVWLKYKKLQKLQKVS